MSFPISIFLYIYFAFLVFWLILSLVGFYHLVRFGNKLFGSFLVGIIYIAGVICIAYISYLYLSSVDWTMQISIFADTSFLKNNPIIPSNPF